MRKWHQRNIEKEINRKLIMNLISILLPKGSGFWCFFGKNSMWRKTTDLIPSMYRINNICITFTQKQHQKHNHEEKLLRLQFSELTHFGGHSWRFFRLVSTYLDFYRAHSSMWLGFYCLTLVRFKDQCSQRTQFWFFWVLNKTASLSLSVCFLNPCHIIPIRFAEQIA